MKLTLSLIDTIERAFKCRDQLLSLEESVTVECRDADPLFFHIVIVIPYEEICKKTNIKIRASSTQKEEIADYQSLCPPRANGTLRYLRRRQIRRKG